MDSDAPLMSWPAELGVAAAAGLATVVAPVYRWPARAQWALHGTLGAAAGLGMAWLLHHEDEVAEQAGAPAEDAETAREEPAPNARMTAALALGTAAVVVAISAGGTLADRATEQALTRRGVRHPRWWLGAAAAVLSLAGGVADRRGSSS